MDSCDNYFINRSVLDDLPWFKYLKENLHFTHGEVGFGLWWLFWFGSLCQSVASSKLTDVKLFYKMVLALYAELCFYHSIYTSFGVHVSELLPLCPVDMFCPKCLSPLSVYVNLKTEFVP
jgi:hypothetical protein